MDATHPTPATLRLDSSTLSRQAAVRFALLEAVRERRAARSRARDPHPR